MSHCVTLFLTDEEHLHAVKSEFGEAAFVENNEHNGYLFFEKFFDHRIEVGPVSVYDAMQEYDKRAPEQNVSQVFDKIEKRLLEKLCDMEEREAQKKTEQSTEFSKQAIVNLKEAIDAFRGSLSTPRRISKLYDTIDKYHNRVNQAFGDRRQREPKAIYDYFENLELDELLFYLAYLKVCFPDEAKQLESQGRSYFEGFVPKNHPAVLTELGEPLLFERGLGGLGSIHFDYLQNRRLAFIDTFYQDIKKLPDELSLFTTQEDEWFHALDSGKTAFLASVSDWNQVFEAVLRKFAFCNPGDSDEEMKQKWEIGQNYIKKLFLFMKGQLQTGEWTSDEALSFMDPARHNEQFLSQNLAIMRAFFEICGERFSESSQSLAKMLRVFSTSYVSGRMMPAKRLLPYIMSSEKDSKEQDNELLKKIDLVFISSPTAKMGMDQFFATLSKLTDPPDCGDGEDSFARLERLADCLEKRLREDNLLRFKDVKQDLSLMRLSTEDMRYFYMLLSRLEPEDSTSRLDVSSLNGPQIYEELMRLRELLVKSPSEFEDDHKTRFHRLFNRIQTGQDIHLTEEQIDDLQQFLSECSPHMRGSVSWFRKVLVDYRHNILLSRES